MSFRRRVVVTGLGLVTPLGASTLSTWRALTAGRVAVRLSPSLGVPVAEVPLAPTSDPDVVPFDLGSWSKPTAIETAAIPNGSHWPKHVAFGVAAATQAVHDAGLEPLAPQRRHRAGVAFGTGIGSLEETTETYATLQARVRALGCVAPAASVTRMQQLMWPPNDRVLGECRRTLCLASAPT